MDNNRFVSSDMTPEELEEFLHEIDDEEVEFNSDFVPKQKIIVSEINKPTVKPIKRVAEAEFYKARVKEMHAARAASMADKRRQVRLIKNEFVMSGRAIELNTPIPTVVFKKMIEIISQPFYDRANAARDLLTRHIEKELKKFIPHTLKVLYFRNKAAFSEYKGFEYVTTAFYGNIKISIKPDIPNVFTNPSEMDIIRAKCGHKIYLFDRLAEKYYYMTKRRITTETRLAIRLTTAKNLLGVLDLGIKYYEVYLQAIKLLNQQVDESAD